MDATTAGSEKAVAPVPAGSDAAASSARAARQPPLAYNAAAAAAASAESGAGAEEEDDEQVERFYALLANIRAMRGAYMAGGETAGNGARKRLRGAEPPWRPAFRLEDFEETHDTERATTKRRNDALPPPAPGKQQQADTGPSSRRITAAGCGRTALPQ